MTDIIIIILMVIPLVVAMLLNVRRLRAQNRAFADIVHPNMRLAITHALKRLNCKVEWKKEHDESVVHYTYQGGHFNINLGKDSHYARMTFLFFFEADISYLETVRMLCNLCNLNSDVSRIVYTLDSKQGKVDLHVLISLPLNYKTISDELERSMSEAFRWQNSFITKFKEEEKRVHELREKDIEKSDAENERGLELVREQEMMHQDAGPGWHESSDKPFTLRDMTATAMGLSGIIPISLTIVAGGVQKVIDDPDAILGYDMSAPLIEGTSFTHGSAMGRLEFFDPRDTEKRRCLMFDFEEEGKTSDTLYYRVSMMLVPLSLSRKVDEYGEQRATRTTSVLLGHDLTPSSERLARFRYVWKEAMGKLQNDDMETMTDDEKLLAELSDYKFHIAHDVYRGRRLFLRKRYYEALLPLTNAFHAMTRGRDIRDSSTVRLLDMIAFFIGSCYMALNQYDRACYYLQLTLPTTNEHHAEAYINCLVNSDDYRALGIINNMLASMQMMMDQEAGGMDDDDDDDDSHNAFNTPERRAATRFVSFLKRRKAFLLVNEKRFDEAEALLKQLLNDPDNSDFALNELAYIQKHK